MRIFINSDAPIWGGVNYHLYTAFPFICSCIGLKVIHLSGGVLERIPKIICDRSVHTIQDSGLFTLMFGSHKGEKSDSLLECWYENLVEFTANNNNNATVVEVDCQKVLGVEKAWDFRRRMKTDLPKNRQINVFHIEDGQKGLDRLIEFSDYIAISIPELRVIGKKGYAERVANYIKNKKPDIDIHLLGCTEVKMIKDMSFCSSSDSTSWKSILRYGDVDLSNGERRRYKDINKQKIISDYGWKMKAFVSDLGLREITQTGLINYSSLIFQAEQLKQKYTEYAGNQD